jgi:hypothetical protein
LRHGHGYTAGNHPLVLTGCQIGAGVIIRGILAPVGGQIEDHLVGFDTNFSKFPGFSERNRDSSGNEFLPEGGPIAESVPIFWGT